MNKFRYILHTLLASGLLLASSGCADSSMDNRTPKTNIGLGDFFKTENDLRMYSYGLYNFGSNWMYVADQGTDNQATTSPTEGKIIMSSPNPNSTTISSEWEWKSLKSYNLLIQGCANEQIPEEARKHFEGVGRLFRAIFYYNKVKRYSDVPWIDKPLETDDEELLNAKREDRATIVDKIIDDLTFASQNMRVNVANKGELHQDVATAYLARIALHEGTFRRYHPELNLQSTSPRFLQIARDAAKKIMDSGRYQLYSTGKPQQDYHDLFISKNLENNPEMVFARYYDAKLYQTGFWAFSFGSYESCPTKDMLQSYLMKDGSYYTSDPGYKTKLFVEEFKDRDPRLAQTYAYPGWELVNTSTYAAGKGVYVQQLSKNFSGYHLIKGFINKTDQESNDDQDVPLIRYAELLLIYAEAKAELGELTQADVDRSINLIRKRVGMPNFDMNPSKDQFMAEKHPGISPLLLEIRRERRVELAFEGFRHDDLYRWHAGKLLEKEPEGIYFPSLGKFDMTGDGIPDLCLIPSSQSIPAESEKETNSLGRKLNYYKAGPITDANATAYLSNGTSGNIITTQDMGKFVEPQFYYRPIPRHQIELNKNLLPQPFGWE